MGKYRAFAAPICALAAMRFCSACRMSGRLSSRSEGSPAGTAGRTSVSMVLPLGIGPGFRPSRMLRRVFLLGNDLFDLRDGGQGRLVFGLRLAELDFRDDAALEALLEQLCTCLPGLLAVCLAISSCLSRSRRFT